MTLLKRLFSSTTVFQQGRSPAYPSSAFNVDFDKGNLVWHLNGHVVTATKNPNQRCADLPPSSSPSPSASASPEPSASPSSSPSPELSPSSTPTNSPEPSSTPSVDPTPLPSFEPITDIVFNPADPESLGELYPNIPGNADTEANQTTEAAITVNDQPLAPAAVGEAIIHVAEPVQENLALIKERYPADVIEMDAADGVYLLKVNLRSIDLSSLEQNLLMLNTEIGDPAEMIRSAGFGNLESARTFALIADLLANQWVKGADFNTYLKTDGNFTSDEGTTNLVNQPVPVPSTSPATTVYPSDAQNYWWLNQHSTNVLQAWDYNLGYNYTANKPVQIAVIDAGFAGLGQLIANTRDFAGQVQVTQGFIDKQLFDYKSVDGVFPLCPTCFAEPVANNPITLYTTSLMSQEDVLYQFN